MNDRLKKIKSTGYWRVEIRPTVFKKDRVQDLATLWSIIDTAKVLLSGWDYPHVDPVERSNGIDYIESGCDWFEFVELWRFYQSGMFIHYFACVEDYKKGHAAEAANRWGQFHENNMPTAYLSILYTLFKVTEIFEFSIRLVQKQILEPAAFIKVELFRTRGRMLFFWEPGRLLRGTYISQLDNIPFELTIPSQELLARGHEIALEKTIYLFERFHWMDVPRQVLLEEQKKFLQKRL